MTGLQRDCRLLHFCSAARPAFATTRPDCPAQLPVRHCVGALALARFSETGSSLGFPRRPAGAAHSGQGFRRTPNSAPAEIVAQPILPTARPMRTFDSFAAYFRRIIMTRAAVDSPGGDACPLNRWGRLGRGRSRKPEPVKPAQDAIRRSWRCEYYGSQQRYFRYQPEASHRPSSFDAETVVEGGLERRIFFCYSP